MKISIDEYINRQQDGQVLNEAFRAGNRARKKESVRDTVEETNPLVDTLLNEINTEDLVRRYLEKNRFMTVHATFRDIILHVLGRLTNVERGVLNHCLQVYTYQQSGGEFGVIHFRTMGSFKTKLDDDRLVFEIKEDEPAKMVADFFERDNNVLLLHIDTHEAKLGESYVTAAGIGFCLKIVEMFNRFRKGTDIYEAFKAGNRARKKESVRDTVDSVNAIDPETADHLLTGVIREVNRWGYRNLFKVGSRLYITEFVRSLFGYATGSSAPGEYLQISSMELDEEGMSGDMWIKYWRTKNDIPYTEYSRRWMISWHLEPDGSYIVFRLADFKDSDKDSWSTPLLVVYPDGSFETGPGFMSFVNDFVTESAKMYKAGMLVPQHPVDEAFRAGNRARKKESVQDTVQGIDDLVTKEKCQETVEKLTNSGGYSSVGINNLLSEVISDTAAAIGGFDDFELATAIMGEGVWEESLHFSVIKSHKHWYPNMCIVGSLQLPIPEDVETDGLRGGIAYTWCILKEDNTPGEQVAWHRITPFNRWIVCDRFVEIIRDIIARAREEKIPMAVSEAFKAGNRARKKEAVADTVQTVEPTITCREAVTKLAEFLNESVRAPWDPRDRMPRCGDEDDLANAIEYAEPEDPEDLYNFDLGLYTGDSVRGFAFDYDTKINISIYEEYGKDANGKRDRSVKIQRVSIGSTGVGSDYGTFDLLKQGRSDSDIYIKPIELTPGTFASLMELCHVLFPLNGNDSKLSYFIGGGNGAERVQTYGQFLYANQELLWPWLCQEDRMLVYDVEDDINRYEEMDEAFRAGNRARKKESVQDTVQEVGESIEEQVKRFEEEIGENRFKYYNLQIIDGRPYMSGPLNLSGFNSLTRLPDNLHVDFYCCISNCPNIEAIPHGLSTKTGALNADHCENLRYVPNDIRINNTIYFNHCPSLESLPDGLKVYKGGIDLSYCTALKSLPENFEVHGPLKVTGCENLKTLPKGLSVDCLECEHSGLTELPLDIRFNDTGLWAFLRPNKEVSKFFHKITGVTFDSDKQPLMKEVWCRWQQENGYVDYGIDLSKPLNEGGKAVKGVSPIRGDLALTVANKAASALMQQLPGVKIVPVGSVGKKPADQESGDIDLAVQVPWEQKDLVIQAVQKLVPDAECREFKALWLISAPWPWREDGLYGRVQLDMFLGPDIRLTQFMRWSPNLAKGESKYKGLYRTALLISIASCIPAEGRQDVKFDGSDCLKDCWRYSLSPRTGLRIVHKTWASKTGKMLKNPKNVDKDTVIVAVDPQIIAVKLLGEGATLNDCVSLESVWKRMQSPQFPYRQYQDQILKEYYKYLQDAGEELPAMKQNEDNTDVKKD